MIYLLFTYDRYYPEGGSNDYKRTYFSINAAREAALIAIHEFGEATIMAIDCDGKSVEWSNRLYVDKDGNLHETIQ